MYSCWARLTCGDTQGARLFATTVTCHVSRRHYCHVSRVTSPLLSRVTSPLLSRVTSPLLSRATCHVTTTVSCHVTTTVTCHVTTTVTCHVSRVTCVSVVPGGSVPALYCSSSCLASTRVWLPTSPFMGLDIQAKYRNRPGIGVFCYVIIVTANIWSSPMKVAWSHGLVSRSILAVSVLAPMITAGVLTSLQSPAAAPCLQLPLLGSAVVVSLVPPPVVWVGCR